MSWLGDKFSKRNLQVLSNPFDSRNLGSIQHAFSLGENLVNGGSITGAFHDSLKEDPAGAAAVESTTAVDSKAKYEANRQADVLANKAGVGGGYGDKFRQKQMDTYDPDVSSERDRFGSGAKSAAAAMALYAGGSALLGGEAGAVGGGGSTLLGGEGSATAAELAAADAGAGLIPVGEVGAATLAGGGTGTTAGGGIAGSEGAFTGSIDSASQTAQPRGLNEPGGGGFNWQDFASKGLRGMMQGDGAGGGGSSDQIAHQMRVAEMLRQQQEYDERTRALMTTRPPTFEGGYQ